MSRKNFKVATAENGKTTIIDMREDKTPTGKVTTMADKEARRKAREEQYVNFRIGALKRRAKRMGLTEEQTNVKIEELKKQIASTKNYHILILFNKKNAAMIKEMLLNDNIKLDIFTDSHCYITGDADLLKDLREMLPQGTKIHPYAIKKPPILPNTGHVGSGYVAKNTDKSTTAKARRNAKKVEKLAIKKMSIRAHKCKDFKFIAKADKEKRTKKQRKLDKAFRLFQKRALKASKKLSSTITQLKAKKASNRTKSASTAMIPRRRQNFKKAA